MSDIHFLGSFATLHDVYYKYPAGGVVGDYINLAGNRVDWNDSGRKWGDFDPIDTESKETQETKGHLVVNGNLTVSGDIKGNKADFNNLSVKDIVIEGDPFSSKDHNHNTEYSDSAHTHNIENIKGVVAYLNKLINIEGSGTGNHFHANKLFLDSLKRLGDYLILEDDATGTYVKVKAGYADKAGGFTSDIERLFARIDKTNVFELVQVLKEGVKFGDIGSVSEIDSLGRAVLLTLKLISDATFGGSLMNDGTFREGPMGEGWAVRCIDNRWRLDIDDVVIRGTLTVFELIISKIRSMNGDLLITQANDKVVEVIAITEASISISVEDNSMNFKVGDFVHSKKIDLTFCGIVTGFSDNNVVVLDILQLTGELVKGSELVQIGNTTDTTRQSAIYFAGNDGKPRMEILNGINTRNYGLFSEGTFGDLSGIIDPDFATESNPRGQLSGVGMYAKNAFLKGVFFLKSTGKSIESEINAINSNLEGIVLATNERFETIFKSLPVDNLILHPEKWSFDTGWTFDGYKISFNNGYPGTFGVSNIFTTVPGEKYTVRFDYANPNGATRKITLDIQSVEGTSATGSILTSDFVAGEVYQTFTATTAKTRLSFSFKQVETATIDKVAVYSGEEHRPWSPAASESDSALTELETKITQTAEKIELNAKAISDLGGVVSKNTSSISVMASEIKSTVQSVSDLSESVSAIDQKADSISLSVSNLKAGGVNLIAQTDDCSIVGVTGSNRDYGHDSEQRYSGAVNIFQPKIDRSKLNTTATISFYAKSSTAKNVSFYISDGTNSKILGSGALSTEYQLFSYSFTPAITQNFASNVYLRMEGSTTYSTVYLTGEKINGVAISNTTSFAKPDGRDLYFYFRNKITNFDNLKVGKQCVFSFDIKCDKAVTFSAARMYSADNWSTYGTLIPVIDTGNITTGYTRLNFLFNITKSGVFDSTAMFAFTLSRVDCMVFVKNMMLSEGNVIVDYTGTTDENVKKTISEINLSPGEIQISADKIRLTGTTFADRLEARFFRAKDELGNTTLTLNETNDGAIKRYMNGRVRYEIIADNKGVRHNYYDANGLLEWYLGYDGTINKAQTITYWQSLKLVSIVDTVNFNDIKLSGILVGSEYKKFIVGSSMSTTYFANGVAKGTIPDNYLPTSTNMSSYAINGWFTNAGMPYGEIVDTGMTDQSGTANLQKLIRTVYRYVNGFAVESKNVEWYE